MSRPIDALGDRIAAELTGAVRSNGEQLAIVLRRAAEVAEKIAARVPEQEETDNATAIDLHAEIYVLLGLVSDNYGHALREAVDRYNCHRGHHKEPAS